MHRRRWIALSTIALRIVIGHVAASVGTTSASVTTGTRTAGVMAVQPLGQLPSAPHRRLQVVRTADEARVAAQAQTAATPYFALASDFELQPLNVRFNL